MTPETSIYTSAGWVDLGDVRPTHSVLNPDGEWVTVQETAWGVEAGYVIRFEREPWDITFTVTVGRHNQLLCEVADGDALILEQMTPAGIAAHLVDGDDVWLRSLSSGEGLAVVSVSLTSPNTLVTLDAGGFYGVTEHQLLVR